MVKLNTNYTKLISKSFGLFKNIPFLPILIDEQLKILTLFTKPKVFENMIELNKWIKSLDNIKTKYHKYGGIEYTLNAKEICHIHGDGLVDVKLTKELKSKYINKEQVEPHHELPTSNMISYQLTKNDNLELIKEIIYDAYLTH